MAGIPKVAPLSSIELNEVAAVQLDLADSVVEGRAFELTARRPYDPNGHMDFFRPALWDCESDSVLMTPIVTGPSPGMWEGTAGYVNSYDGDLWPPPCCGAFLWEPDHDGSQRPLGYGHGVLPNSVGHRDCDGTLGRQRGRYSELHLALYR